ncbi:hypothetical protein N2152v2_002873 [Parachlorella kessleri]
MPMQGSVLAREALASAAVALYAAATLPSGDPRAAALHFSEGLLLPGPAAVDTPAPLGAGAGSTTAAPPAAALGGGSIPTPAAELRLRKPGGVAKLVAERGGPGAVEGPSLGLLDEELRSRGSCLVAELQSLPAISRVCALKGLLYALPMEVCCTPLLLLKARPGVEGEEGDGGGQPWMLLTDGAISVLSEAVRAAADAHFKFHAVRALAVCLDRIREALSNAAAAGSGTRETPSVSEGGSSRGDAGGTPIVSQSQSSAAVGEEEGGGDQPKGLSARAQAVLGFANGVAAATGIPMPGADTEVGGAASAAGDDGRALSASGAAEGGPVLPLLSDMLRDQLRATLWSAWEDPLGQTVKQVHDAFATLLDIVELQARLAAQHAQQAQQAQQQQGADAFLLACARELLSMDVARKSRYAPLAALVPRVGAGALLEIQPDLIPRALAAMEDHTVCSSVGTVLGSLWGTLHCEAAAADDQVDGSASSAWAAHWLVPLLTILAGPNEVLRHNVAVYALPQLLQLDPGAMGLLLRRLLGRMGGVEGEGAAAACVTVLKAGRQLQLLSDLHDGANLGLDAAAVEAILQRTVVHRSESIRLDSLQLVCVHPKATTLPTALELRIVSKFVALTLRCASSALRNKFLSLMSKLLARIRLGVAFVLSRPKRQQTPDMLKGVALSERWLRWLSNTLMASVYPGAPFARTFMAVELLNALLEGFGDLIVPGQAPTALPSGCEVRPLPPGSFAPFCPGFASKALVDLLLVAAVDTWDKLRESAYRALLQLPTPLPGLEEGAAVEQLLAQALLLVNSPRLGESDAGAKLVLLVFLKYAAQLGWRISLGPPATAAVEGFAPSGHEALLHFLEGACCLLQASIYAGRQDMLEACTNSLAHGALITLRYLVGEVPWAELTKQEGHAERARALPVRLLALDFEAAALVYGPLCQPQEQNMGAGDVDANDVDLDEPEAEEGSAVDEEGCALGLGPKAQVIITGCWLTMKECSLVLATIVRSVPLSGSEAAHALLSVGQVKAVGDHFVDTLCHMKHNGAIDKTQAGFLAVCERLLREPAPALNSLPQSWLSSLLAFLQRPGQTRSDIVRRSAGLPYAFNTLFAAEPCNSHKILMKQGMEEMLRLASSEGLPEPWPRVHALNVLRVAFSNAALATDTSAYYAKGLEASLLAMAAPQWEVRNGATLCYTSLLVRMLGFRNAASQDRAAKRAMSVADFFAQYPALHPFLLSQLGQATEELECGRGRAMHPSLFPVLALLSRLRPSLHSRLSAHTAIPSPAAFVPFVRRCAAAEPLAVRQLAARALAPLLSPAELPGTLADLAEDVAGAICGGSASQDDRSAHGEGSAYDGSAGSSGRQAAVQGVGRPPANAVHGWLLQLRVLLEGAAARKDVPAAELASGVAQVARHLRRCVGVCALGHYGCAPLSLEYLKVCRALALLATQQAKQAQAQQEPDTAQQAQQELLRLVGQHCWDAIARPASALNNVNGDAANPMTSASYKAAAELYFGPLRAWRVASSEGSPSGLPLAQEVKLALSSSKYEVRSATLKQLVKLLSPAGSHSQPEQPHYKQQQQQQQQQQPQQPRGAHGSLGGLPQESLAVLRSILVRHALVEEHHKAARRTLCLLCLLPPPPGPTPESTAHASLEPVVQAPPGDLRQAGSSPSNGTLTRDAAGAQNPGPCEESQLADSLQQRARCEADPAIRQHAVRCLGLAWRAVLSPELAAAAAGCGPRGGAWGATRTAGRHGTASTAGEHGTASTAGGCGTGITEDEASTADVSQPLRPFLDVLQGCSQPWQLPELRWAAVAALDASGLLALGAATSPDPTAAAAAAALPAQEVWAAGQVSSGMEAGSDAGNRAQVACQLPDWLVAGVVEGWAVAMRLLEEEEVEVRDAMAAIAAAAAAAGSARIAGTAAASSSAGTAAAAASMAAAGSQEALQQGCVEWVERQVFPALAARFGPHPALLRQLCAWVYEEELQDTSGAVLDGAGDQQSNGTGKAGVQTGQAAEEGTAAHDGKEGAGGVMKGSPGEERRLFDRELDNHHEEPLLIAQLAAETLAHLASELQPGGKAATLLLSWAGSALCHLEAAVPALLPAKAQAQGACSPWLQYGEAVGAVQGGFVPVYRALLAVWVGGHVGGGAASSGAGSSAIPARLVRLFDGEGAAVEQPQLRSLVAKVLRLWGCHDTEPEPNFEELFLVGKMGLQ